MGVKVDGLVSMTNELPVYPRNQMDVLPRTVVVGMSEFARLSYPIERQETLLFLSIRAAKVDRWICPEDHSSR